MNNDTTTETVKREPKKWTLCPTNPAGRIQISKFEKVFRSVGFEHNHFKEISGIIGKPETQNTHGYHAIFGGGRRDDVITVQCDIGDKYGYILSRENAPKITAEFAEALKILSANPAIVDKRITQEAHDETERANAVSRAKYEAQEAERKRVAQEQALANPLGSVAFNREHNGVEITFNEKPDDNLRYQLKRAGFRITRRPPWKHYQKFSRQAWAAACKLAQVNTVCPLDKNTDENPNGKPHMNEENTPMADEHAGGYVAAQEAAYEDNMAVQAGVFNEMAGA